MEAKRLGNLDILLIVKRNKLERALSLRPGTLIDKCPIKSGYSNDPVHGNEIQLIYNPNRDRANGFDCSEVVEHLQNPPIPVYIAPRGIKLVLEDGESGGAFLSYQLRVKVED